MGAVLTRERVLVCLWPVGMTSHYSDATIWYTDASAVVLKSFQPACLVIATVTQCGVRTWGCFMYRLHQVDSTHYSNISLSYKGYMIVYMTLIGIKCKIWWDYCILSNKMKRWYKDSFTAEPFYKQICFPISCQFWLGLWKGTKANICIKHSVSSQRLASGMAENRSHKSANRVFSVWFLEQLSCLFSVPALLGDPQPIACWDIHGEEIPQPCVFKPRVKIRK